jgi:Holliday junction resolvasome RuvABC endonuclease subunit
MCFQNPTGYACSILFMMKAKQALQPHLASEHVRLVYPSCLFKAATVGKAVADGKQVALQVALLVTLQLLSLDNPALRCC